MREQGQVNLKPVLSDFARRKWGVIWRLGNPTEKRAQILTGTGQNQFTKDTLARIRKTIARFYFTATTAITLWIGLTV